MAHNKKYIVLNYNSGFKWFGSSYADTKWISLTLTTFVKHFNLDRKHGKPSKQTIIAVVNKFLKTRSVLDAVHEWGGGGSKGFLLSGKGTVWNIVFNSYIPLVYESRMNNKSYTRDTSMHLVFVSLINMPLFLVNLLQCLFLEAFWYYAFWQLLLFSFLDYLT